MLYTCHQFFLNVLNVLWENLMEILKGPIPSLKQIEIRPGYRVITLRINSACGTMEFYRKPYGTGL